MHRVGFTTTIPLEIVLAAGMTPVDLNNVFITSPHATRMIEEAEVDGFPRSICGWIKGIYAAVVECGIHELIAVTEGDCSNTRALMEVLSLKGVETIPFAYPHDRDPAGLRFEIEKLMRRFGVGWDAVKLSRERLGRIRRKVKEIDRLTWDENRVSGQENHYFQVCTSDMNSDPDRFEAEVDAFLEKARQREPFRQRLRLAYIGVPPIMTDLYPFVETLDARVVFNETQRQFAMPFDTPDLVEQYRAYTYPYDIFHRLSDILMELERRKVDAVIHYVQSFCFRQIEDMIVRQKLPLPVLTLEGDKPGPLDARTRIRIEGFLEMLA
ncbi:2-hydroxyacyl-CoA dehydratase [Geobacter sulfurreducens]|uniref:(R)-2-hydroxyacyl-CoA dehydratase n=1 Tax=Geobacter sulfurreducens (strain ATCC 51573 / DSM 12127 / PCA) TaxID=243231 RepID=Q748S6_GEOSL|nr:2-hydroxyacyl-CoA dehydratase [Geobacter sulfurreducens]AAR36317.1 (R)-2-hydroxyacyl-CoA dehydratase [Geobacter sulfurreducens PCA]AJY69188.1 2-hydroxyglutaryl-CoA dehydratase [Geobacter sulfurreducens]QVW34738.1 2-hydroxyacyl-CoA dehydratase [Geobacter sulfurreducens]UAC03606.1 2-hydroxyacyl-CoA dehydratase [Geobacter sulfurreducens]UTG92244.1 2-hydroxyacyl-CoA dehydratase [Geobacter sulfurreducens]